tara:strand:+ start:181 stop:450 length:270 start_codon:yes stop_codon:yes gene_type:complete
MNVIKFDQPQTTAELLGAFATNETICVFDQIDHTEVIGTISSIEREDESGLSFNLKIECHRIHADKTVKFVHVRMEDPEATQVYPPVEA